MANSLAVKAVCHNHSIGCPTFSRMVTDQERTLIHIGNMQTAKTSIKQTA